MTRILPGQHFDDSVNVLTTPTPLVGTRAGRPQTERLNIIVTAGAADIWLGGPAVSQATGTPLKAGTQVAFDSAGGLFAIAAANTTITILEGF